MKQTYINKNGDTITHSWQDVVSWREFDIQRRGWTDKNDNAYLINGERLSWKTHDREMAKLGYVIDNNK